jgi:hypothetical protein
MTKAEIERNKTCACGEPKDPRSKQCWACGMRARGVLHPKAGRNSHRVPQGQEGLADFFAQRKSKFAKKLDEGIDRVNAKKAELDDIAAQTRLPNTLARVTRAETYHVHVRGNASGHAMGRRSPLLAEERMAGNSTSSGVMTRYGDVDMQNRGPR